MEDHEWEKVLELRRIHDRLGSMRGLYLWIGVAAAVLGAGQLLSAEKGWKTTTLSVLFLLMAVVFFLGRWRVFREPRLWTMLLASIFTALGAVSVLQYFFGAETIRGQGLLFFYVVGLVLVLGLWSIVPGPKTLLFLHDNKERWEGFLSGKKPVGR